MPHPSPPLLDRILSSLSSGTARSDAFGLTVIPVGSASVPTRSPPRVVFGETDPPAPTQVMASNPTRHAIIVPLGQVVTGGMTDRVLATTVTIPPRETSVVPVEPLSPRWWNAGAMRAADGVPPALCALLILAGGARPGLRSIARTALWSAYEERRPEVTPTPSEWVLLDGSRVLGLHLVRGAPTRGLRRAAPPMAARGMAVRGAQSEEPSASVVQRLLRHGRGMELWLVRASLDLPDLILGATRG